MITDYIFGLIAFEAFTTSKEKGPYIDDTFGFFLWLSKVIAIT